MTLLRGRKRAAYTPVADVSAVYFDQSQCSGVVSELSTDAIFSGAGAPTSQRPLRRGGWGSRRLGGPAKRCRSLGREHSLQHQPLVVVNTTVIPWSSSIPLYCVGALRSTFLLKPSAEIVVLHLEVPELAARRPVSFMNSIDRGTAARLSP